MYHLVLYKRSGQFRQIFKLLYKIDRQEDKISRICALTEKRKTFTFNALTWSIKGLCIYEEQYYMKCNFYKPFPSTSTLLSISALVLVPSPIFHSTLQSESGKHIGLSRHCTLQCSNCLHRTS